MTTKAQLYLNEQTTERSFEEELAAKDREIARLRTAIDDFFLRRFPPASDPVEAMRAKCEEIAREREKDWHNISGNPCSRIADAIAALKIN